MKLYRVSSSGIKLLDVKKETRCGWREHNGGFLNRCELREYSRYTGGNWFYTTDKSQAIEWANKLYIQMYKDLAELNHSIETLSTCEVLV